MGNLSTKKDCYANILLGSGRVEWLIRVTLTQCLSLTVWTGGKNDTADKAATASHALMLSQSRVTCTYRSKTALSLNTLAAGV